MPNALRIAVLSGKGGTGKTFVSTNLANVGKNTIYIDCDVEEPNGSFFIPMKNPNYTNVTVKIPMVNPILCTGCRMCTSFCQFNALAMINNQIKVFEEVCHSCGGCSLVCEAKAITEKNKIIGVITEDNSQTPMIRSGKLNIGEESGVPIIHQLLKMPHSQEVEIIDSPPGTSCSVVESISQADYCIIVGEPTLFSLENLKMVVNLVRGLQIPFGIVINKEHEDDNLLRAYAKKEKINILQSFPYKSDFALLTSKGELVTNHNNVIQKQFIDLFEATIKEISR